MLAAWSPVGPASILDGQTAGLTEQENPVAGAVQAVAPHPTNPDVLYIGAVNGGIWRTDNAQDASPTWTPLTDNLPSLSIGDLQFDPTDPSHNTLIAGFGRFSSFGRDGDDLRGLIRTTDGGASWTEITGNGVLLSKNITAVAGRGNVIVAAVNGASPFTIDNIGIFRSTDGGATFSHVSGANGSGLPLGRTLEMVSDPTNPQVLYASLTDGGSNNGIYKSSDTGATWTRVSSAEMNALIMDAGSERTNNIQMSVGQSNNVFVAIINAGQLAAVYRSGSGGADWTSMDVPSTNENGTDVGINPLEDEEEHDSEDEVTDDPGGQGSIHFSLVADPVNPNIVYAGGDRQPKGALDMGTWPNAVGATNYTGRLFRGDASLAAGSQWTPLTDNFADPDGTDGPLPGTGPHADSRDMAFDAAGNLIEGDDGGVYRRLSPTSTTGVWRSVIGNLQITEFVSVAYSSLTNTVIGGAQDVGTSFQSSESSAVWREFAQGDGGVVAIDDSQPGTSIRYGSSQFLGNFGRATFDASNNFVSYAAAGLVGLNDSPQFYSPYVLNTVQPSRLVIGTQSRVYESLDQGDTVADLGAIGTPISFAYGGFSGGVANADVLYVGTVEGLFLRDSAGATLQEITAYPGDEPEDIVLDPLDWRHAFVIDTSDVFMTTDAGQSWSNITFGLQDSQLRTIEYVTSSSSESGIVVGGNAGVSVLRFGKGDFWLPAASDLPGAPVLDLHFDATDNVLVAGTLGRGAWMVTNASDVLNPTGLQISDVALAEGDVGLTNFVFTVTQPASTQATTVVYATSDVTALAPLDYLAQSGTLSFAPGETSKVITIQVVADVVVEANETFLVTLSDAINTSISKESGIGTIINDDVDVSIGDVVLTEGNEGTTNAVFVISAYGAINRTISVTYSTLNQTAQGATDYLPVAGSVILTADSSTARVTVPVLGDRLDEDNETFAVTLIAAQGARIADGLGVATILDDDALPSLYVNDVQVTTTSAGTFAAVFTVGLDAVSGRAVTANFNTSDFGAQAGVDYASLSGVITFAPGVRTQSVAVPIMTGAVYSADKKFHLNLTSASNALLVDPEGLATIVFGSGPVGERIIDNGDSGYSHGSNWTSLTNTLAYGLDYDYHAAGSGTSNASYTFTGLAPGSYEVYTKWVPFSNRATNAPYTILNGNTVVGTVAVNQQVAPTGDVSNGVTWQKLGTYDASSGTLIVRLGDNANGYVIADAVRLVAGGIGSQAPEINLAGLGLSINTNDTTPSQTDGTEFGNTDLNSDSAVHTFTIFNNGNSVLHLGGSPRVLISGANAADFIVTTQPAATVNPNGSTSFGIFFRPTSDGLRTAKVTIANDDSDEGPYTFTIQGTGVAVASPFVQNKTLPQDVNADSRVSTSDLLALVNSMLRMQTATPLASTSGAGTSQPEMYLDVTGDGRLTTSDLLSVVNYLLRVEASPQAVPAAAPQTAPSAGLILFDDLGQAPAGEANSQLEVVAGSQVATVTPSTAAATPLETEAVNAVLAATDDDPIAQDEELDWDLLALDV